MNKLALKIVTALIAIYIATLIFPSITYDNITALLWAGLALGLINLSLRPLLVIISLPVNLLTLGLFTLVVDAWMVLLTDWLVRGLDIPGFWTALAVALLVAVFSWLFRGLMRGVVI